MYLHPKMMLLLLHIFSILRQIKQSFKFFLNEKSGHLNIIFFSLEIHGQITGNLDTNCYDMIRNRKKDHQLAQLSSSSSSCRETSSDSQESIMSSNIDDESTVRHFHKHFIHKVIVFRLSPDTSLS